MGIGLVAISTTQKKEPSGSPFTIGSARNGASIDSAGKVVLGNDVADPLAPAQLISNREIITEDVLLNLFAVILNSIQTGITTTLDGQAVRVAAVGNSPLITADDTGSGFPTVQATVSGGIGGTAQVVATATAGDTAQFFLSGGNDRLGIRASNSGTILFRIGNIIDVMGIDTVNFQIQVGPGLTTFNGADFQVSGSLTNRLFVQSQGAGTHTVDRDLDSNKQFINSAAANFTLPNMVGANNRLGFIFRACVKNAAGITVTASAGQIIRFGSLSTSSGGTLVSTDVGAYVVIIWDASNWITESFNGAWLLT